MARRKKSQEVIAWTLKKSESLLRAADLNALNRLNAKDGIIRIMPLLRELDCVKYGTLTEEDKEIAHAMLYAKFYNKTVVNEFRYFKENAEIVANGETPQVPMLLFTSNDARKQDWPECVQRYAGNVKDAVTIQLNCPHYVHDYEFIRISDETKAFLNEVR